MPSIRAEEKFLKYLKWVLPALLVLVLIYSYNQSNESETEIFYIEEGETAVEVVDQLYKDGYIQNRVSYGVAKVLAVLQGDIRPGGYALSKKMGAYALQAALGNPEYKYIKVEPGMRKGQIADLLASELKWDSETREAFINNFPICAFTGGEGYLYPGEYLVHRDDGPQEIKLKMEQRLFDSIEELIGGEDGTVINVNQIITIASLIQKEAAGNGDMRLISGIIWNRLFNSMPLQIDATLQYAKGNEKVWWPQVYSDDKYINSPYNTYQNDGLPPGPIASPGKAAITSALSPKDTSCIFYLHDNNGNIHCTTTYAKHKQNVSYYLK